MKRGGSILMVAGLLAVGGCGGDDGPAPDEPVARGVAAPGAPNVIIMMTDDQPEAGWRRWMPTVRRQVAGHGAVFENSFATTPLCCPSRATFLTGQYAHNHGILENHPGYPVMSDPGSVLPVWLKQAGYETAHVGKWLHGYADQPGTDGGTQPPPGWDTWIAPLQAKYYDYDLSVDGDVVRHDQAEHDYTTEVITRHAVDFIRDAAEGRAPFFLSLAYLAPHRDQAMPEAGGECGAGGHAVPAPGDRDRVERTVVPRASPALNEADVSDKPPFFDEDLPLLTAAELESGELAERCVGASLRSVDRSVGTVLELLEAEGELERTLVIFTSDNGFLNGQHRVDNGKSLPYQESAGVPLAIRPPGGTEARAVASIAANIDLAPTILDYARARPCLADGACRELDGRSLRPLADGELARWEDHRAVLIENTKRKYGVCQWDSVRTVASTYTYYRLAIPGEACSGREQELYDARRDPYELENVAGDPGEAERLERMDDLRKRLVRCEGADCR